MADVGVVQCGVARLTGEALGELRFGNFDCDFAIQWAGAVHFALLPR